MPRSPRTDFPGARHHVVNRAPQGQGLFSDDADYGHMMEALGEVPVRFGAVIHGYALLPDHFHLMVEVPRGNLSQVMRFVGATVTRLHHTRHGTQGPLFRGRYANRPVDGDAYWKHLLAFLHLHPVRSGRAPHATEAPWTSHRAYLALDQPPPFLTTAPLLSLFGSGAELAAYVTELADGQRPAPEGFHTDRLFAGPEVLPPPTPPPPTRSPEQVLRDVSEVLDIPVERVLDRPRGRTPNLSAWLAAWWMTRATGLSQAQIAERLGVSRGRVSHYHRKLMVQARQHAHVKRAMSTLDQLLQP